MYVDVQGEKCNQIFFLEKKCLRIFHGNPWKSSTFDQEIQKVKEFVMRNGNSHFSPKKINVSL